MKKDQDQSKPDKANKAILIVVTSQFLSLLISLIILLIIVGNF